MIRKASVWYSTQPSGTKAGTTASSAAAPKAVTNWEVPATASTVSHVSDSNGPYPKELEVPTAPAKRPPAMPAMAADMQKTSTWVTVTVVPMVDSASGESDRARSRRPSRLRYTGHTARQASTITAQTT